MQLQVKAEQIADALHTCSQIVGCKSRIDSRRWLGLHSCNQTKVNGDCGFERFDLDLWPYQTCKFQVACTLHLQCAFTLQRQLCTRCLYTISFCLRT